MTSADIVSALHPPHLDLTGSFALVAFWVSESASRRWLPFLGVALAVLLVSRIGLRWARRVAEVGVVALVLGVLLGGGSWLNEHVVKPAFAVPRPNIVELAETPPDAPTLKLSAEDFYALHDRDARRAHLREVLTPDLSLGDRVREHWIAEAGYSFPSGHSFAAAMFATFFLAVGRARLSGWRLRVLYLLPAWAVAVCLSRLVLRVHWPLDVCAGGLMGIGLGVLAFRAAVRLMPAATNRQVCEANHC